MTQVEFIAELDKENYSYEIEGDRIVVTDRNLDVYLDSLTSLPTSVVFRNGGYVDLESLKSLSPGVEFMNRGDVYLVSLTSLSPGVEFRNEGDVFLGILIGGWFDDWNSNIEGIDSKRLFNVMIKRGMFI